MSRRDSRQRVRIRRKRSSWRPLVELLDERCLLSTLTVNTVADSGAGSLRQAILDANADSSTDVIHFSIGSGPKTIVPLSPLPNITVPLTIDGRSQPGFVGSPLIEINGESAGNGADGLTVNSSDTTISGLVVNRFSGNGISVDGPTANRNYITGNYIGTDISGTVARGNGTDGIHVDHGGSENTIGGVLASDRNILSGNGRAGVGIGSIENYLHGQFANLVEGNFIGTDLTGTKALPNARGVDLELSYGNTVGGTAVGAGNLIVATYVGIVISADSTGLVAGNKVDTDVTGTRPLGEDQESVTVMNSANVTIGGVAGAGNVFAQEVRLGGTALFEGNFLGTDPTGTVALPGVRSGLSVEGFSSTIGGTLPGEGNVISGEFRISGQFGSLVVGNKIGTDITGTHVLDGPQEGLRILGSSGNTIGGTSSGAGNVIAVGIDIEHSAGNLIQDNMIGTTAQGDKAISGGGGIYGYIASGNTIGGDVLGAGNVINSGILLDRGCDDWLIQGNKIGTDVSGSVVLGQGFSGILVNRNQGVTIGGTTRLAGNVIDGFQIGIYLTGSGRRGDLVQGNFIGVNSTGTKALGNSEDGIDLESAYTTIGGSAQGAGNIISANGGYGIKSRPHDDLVSYGNIIQGNSIGTDRTGSLVLPNGSDGIMMIEQVDSLIGGTEANQANIIANNHGDGVHLFSHTPYLPDSVYVSILGNLIFGNGGLSVHLDPGTNNNQGPPHLLSAVSTNLAGTTVNGTVTGPFSSTSRVELFLNPTLDPSGKGQGKTFLGYVSVAINSSGQGLFTFHLATAVSSGQYVSATVTDAAGDTSAFSSAMAVVSPVEDISSRLSVSRGGFRYDHATQHYFQAVTIANTGLYDLQGPFSLVLDNIRNATLVNKTGLTATVPAGRPYLALAGSILKVGAKVTIYLEFNNPYNLGITYSSRVIAGQGKP